MTNLLGPLIGNISIPAPTLGISTQSKQPVSGENNKKDLVLNGLYQDLTNNILQVGLENIRFATLSLNSKEKKELFLYSGTENKKDKINISIPSPQGSQPIFYVTLKADGETVSSYVKFPQSDPHSSATLELLMWKISKIMRLSEYFVPTKVLKIPFSDGRFSYATIQPEIKGRILGAFTNSRQYNVVGLSQKELAMAVFASILYGMFDAHSYNIMLSGDRVRYFDNAQSLPNSNGFISWSDSVVCRSSYRCGLLDLIQARMPLEMGLVEELLEKAKECRSNIGELRAYLETYMEKSSYKEGRIKLPTYWLEDDSVIESMKKRLDLMIDALENVRCINLVDLAVKANPRYLLAFGIEYLAHLNKQVTVLERAILIQRSHNHHTHISTVLTSDRVIELMKSGYDLQRVIDLSVDAVGFNHFVERLVDYYLEFNNSPKSAVKYKSSLESLFSGVHLDMKEVSEQTVESNINMTANVALLKALGIQHVFLPLRSNECFDVPYERFIVSVLDDSPTLFAYRSKFGLIMRQIKLRSSENVIVYRDPLQGLVCVPINQAGINKLTKTRISNLNQFPSHPPEGCDLFKYGNRVQLSFQDNLLVTHLKDEDGTVKVSRLKYSPSDEELIDNNGIRITLSSYLRSIEKYGLAQKGDQTQSL